MLVGLHLRRWPRSKAGTFHSDRVGFECLQDSWTASLVQAYAHAHLSANTWSIATLWKEGQMPTLKLRAVFFVFVF